MRTKAVIFKEYAECEVNNFIKGEPAIDVMERISTFLAELDWARSEEELEKVVKMYGQCEEWKEE